MNRAAVRCNTTLLPTRGIGQFLMVVSPFPVSYLFLPFAAEFYRYSYFHPMLCPKL